MSVYSFSQIQLYNKCPLAFRYKYIDKIKLQEKEYTSDLILWEIVHKVLENLYNDINVFQKNDLDFYMKQYNSIWKQKIDDISQEWKEIIIKWSWNLSDYIKRGEIYITNYFNENYPFDSIKIISTEQNINFSLNENIKFRWIIDRLDKKWDDFIINDYKTNKNLPTQENEEYKEQLTLYALWIKQKYWKYLKNIYAQLHFLHFDIKDIWQIDDLSLEKIKDKYIFIINEIESKRFNFNMWNKSEFKEVENYWCKFCEYKSICPLFAHSFMNDETISEIWNKTLKSMIDEYWKISKDINNLEKQKNNMKQIFINYSQNKNLSRIYWNNFYISVIKNKTYKILDQNQLKILLEKKWKLNWVLEVSSSLLSKLFKKWELSTIDFKSVVQENIYNTIRSFTIK